MLHVSVVDDDDKDDGVALPIALKCHHYSWSRRRHHASSKCFQSDDEIEETNVVKHFRHVQNELVLQLRNKGLYPPGYGVVRSQQ